MLSTSILPSATPYSRNSIFAGLLPREIAERAPDFWQERAPGDKSKNRYERELLDQQLKRLGNKPLSTKYVKIYSSEESQALVRQVGVAGDRRAAIEDHALVQAMALDLERTGCFLLPQGAQQRGERHLSEASGAGRRQRLELFGGGKRQTDHQADRGSRFGTPYRISRRCGLEVLTRVAVD